MGDLRERITSRLTPCADPRCGCACLLWPGDKNRQGYGRIKVGDRKHAVHIVLWELEHARPVPDGLVLDHVWDRGCRHKNCASMAHLEPVTSGENTRRAIAARGGQNFNAAKDRCPRGHLYDEENTIYETDRSHRHTVHRKCRICKRASSRRAAARRRQSVLAA
jgi:hypothetical protein